MTVLAVLTAVVMAQF